jgi:integrase
MPKLTKRFVDSLTAKRSDYFAWDDELPGFGVRVWVSGRKTYVAQYRKAGRSRRVRIGAHGALTVDEARKEARGILGDVARGEDPAEDRATRRKSLTVNELCDKYLAAADLGLIMGKRGLPKKASTLTSDRGRITQHIRPLLGTKIAKEVTQVDINRFIRDVTVGKTARVVKTGKRGKAVVEGGAGTAARTAGLLGGIFSFAISEGIRTDNPVRGTTRQADRKRKRRLTPAEFRILGKALKAAYDDAEPDQGVAGVWLLALTGCRLSEIEELEWIEVEPANGQFRFLDTKEDAGLRPIGKPAFDVLSKIERKPGNKYVLTAVRSDDNFYGGMDRAMDRIMARTGFTDVTAHTLRHSYASVAGDLGFSDSTIDTLIGHASGSVTSDYIHRLDSVLVAAADKVARAIHGYMTRERRT